MKILKEIKLSSERLCYYLTESRSESGAACYGVTVSTTLFGDEESESVISFSSDMGYAEHFMCLLADNLVLPSTLKEVAEEYIAASSTV